MRYVLAVLSLLLPVSSHAVLTAFDFEGTIFGYGTGEPDPENKIGKSYRGSFSVDEGATLSSYALDVGGESALYKANGQFVYEIEGRRMIKNGILDIGIVRDFSGNSNVHLTFDKASWEDTAELAYGEFWWGYERGTFADTAFANISQNSPFVVGYGHTKRYINGERHEVWDSHSEFRQVVAERDIDNMDVAPNPEPASMLLGALGLGAFGLLRRKSRS